MGDTRMTVRLAAVVTATVIGGGFGALGLGSAGASAAPSLGASAAPGLEATVAAACPTGENQKAVEGYLKKLGGFGKVIVDGRQSAADCAAIKKFQTRYDIRPAEGRAGPLTHRVAKRLATTQTKACKAKKKGTTICVDLTRQTVWVMRDGKVLVKPTVTRTGMKGYRTPTGTFKINRRAKKEWSNPYEVWMPYWQRFVGGVGLHETVSYLHDEWRGSHGCVNLLARDAKHLYGIGKIGMTVKVFGRRPGT